jgi:hypothetical protein
LEKSRIRLDVVSMLLIRRTFAAKLESKAAYATHIYCDASPVSGHELFGAQFDLFEDGQDTVQAMQLPGIDNPESYKRP